MVVPAAPARNGTTLRQPPAASAVLTREYVTGGSPSNWVGNILRTLPHPVDELSRDLGLDIYDRMIKDPQIKACVRLFTAGILEDGVQLGPSITEKDKDGYDKAVEIKEEAEAMLDELDGSLMDVLRALSSAVYYGNRVAEQVYEYRSARTSGKRFLQLAKLKVKPIRSVAFVVDRYMNLVGLTAATGASPIPISVFSSRPADILPRAKFVVLSWEPMDSDPRGTSILEAAYTPWWRKYQIVPEWLRYLAQFGGPSLIGYTPENATATPVLDADGNQVLDPLTGLPRIMTPEEVLLDALLGFQNSTSLALPYSAKVDLVQSKGSGEAFMAGFGLCNQEMTKAILTQELATEQSKNQARAAASVHQDVLETLIRQGKATFARAIVLDIIRPWIRYNYGDDAVKLGPKVSLGTTEEQDRPHMIRAMATLFSSGYIHPSQLPATDRALGLPVRDLTGDPTPMKPLPGGQPGQDGSPPQQDQAAGRGNPTVPPTQTQPKQGGGQGGRTQPQGGTKSDAA